MRMHHDLILTGLLFVTIAGSALAQSATPMDPLPSWNEGKSKAAIVEFVERVTDQSSPDFVPVAERIATFDNDGTLWSEQPLYFQGLYALDRVRKLAPDQPEWSNTEPFQSVLKGDLKGVMATGMPAIEKLIFATHADISGEEFQTSVRDWLATAKHPQTGLPFTKMIFQPMLELMAYLRANDFKVYIVTGGGIDFVRVFSEGTYEVPPEQVVGSSLDAKFEMTNGIPTILKTGKLDFIDDKAGKPVGIYRHIGRRPIFAAGNSDGDLQMLQYTTIPSDAKDNKPGFGLLVHHTDARREWAYDRDSHIGKLEKALDDAPQQGWLIVDMKDDWSKIYP
ncbi:HAD family hydrolase [Blastopirellula marina]|nr:HAD family hydrolase [Blastopirellula marina]